jgi:hypothetical protein
VGRGANRTERAAAIYEDSAEVTGLGFRALHPFSNRSSIRSRPGRAARDGPKRTATRLPCDLRANSHRSPQEQRATSVVWSWLVSVRSGEVSRSLAGPHDSQESLGARGLIFIRWRYPMALGTRKRVLSHLWAFGGHWVDNGLPGSRPNELSWRPRDLGGDG